MTALQALLIFLISFMVVAVLFKMPVSFALGASSLLVLAFGGYNLVTVPQFAFPVWTALLCWPSRSTSSPVSSWNTAASPRC